MDVWRPRVEQAEAFHAYVEELVGRLGEVFWALRKDVGVWFADYHLKPLVDENRGPA